MTLITPAEDEPSTSARLPTCEKRLPAEPFQFVVVPIQYKRRVAGPAAEWEHNKVPAAILSLYTGGK